MPRKRYEEEIEEILEKMDPEDLPARADGSDDSGAPEASGDDETGDEDNGQLISWEEVPESRPAPTRSDRRRRSRTSSFVITPTGLVVVGVFVVVALLATKFWPLIIPALILFGGAYLLNKRTGGPGLMSGTGRQKFWRDSPIDFDDDDSDDGDKPDGGRGGSGWRGG